MSSHRPPTPDAPPLDWAAVQAESRAARGQILAALRSGLGAAGPAIPEPALAGYSGSRFARMPAGTLPAGLNAAAEAAAFQKAAEGWRAEVHAATPQDWPQVVARVLAAHGARRVACGSGLPQQARWAEALAGCQPVVFEAPMPEWRGVLFDRVDAGLTQAWAGIVDTGSLLLRPGPEEPRSLSLVPPVHVAVLNARRLFPSLAAAFAALTPQDDLPTNLVMVSGPSKTADIQQTLAYGAHGPKVLAIVLVDDVTEALR